MRRRRRSRPKYKNPYKLESELCDVLIKHAKENGWRVYPETSGWDILLVKDIQIGVQAKLKDNVEVLAQAIDFGWANPDLRVVLVPKASKEFHAVAKALHIYVIHGASIKWDYLTGSGEWEKAIDGNTTLDKYNKKYLTNSKKKCWVPEVEINVPAGVRSPKIITPWKIKAVKLCIKLNKVGYLTSRDFKAEKVSITLWVDKWLINSGKKLNKLTKYIKAPNAILPDELYPEVTEAILKSMKE